MAAQSPLRNLIFSCLIALCVTQMIIIPFLLIANFGNNIPVDEAGGSFAFSPDGRWQAHITDGHCNANDKPYAVIELWDLKKYPSLKTGGGLSLGKIPEVKLVFPQDFHARDARCDVKWIDNNQFKIEYDSAAGAREFRYDIASDTFVLESTGSAPE